MSTKNKWTLCTSKSFPGHYYLFNLSNGETRWLTDDQLKALNIDSPDGYTWDQTKDPNDLFKQNTISSNHGHGFTFPNEPFSREHFSNVNNTNQKSNNYFTQQPSETSQYSFGKATPPFSKYVTKSPPPTDYMRQKQLFTSYIDNSQRLPNSVSNDRDNERLFGLKRKAENLFQEPCLKRKFFSTECIETPRQEQNIDNDLSMQRNPFLYPQNANIVPKQIASNLFAEPQEQNVQSTTTMLINSFLKPKISNNVTKYNAHDIFTRPDQPNIKYSFLTPQIENIIPKQNAPNMFARPQEQNTNNVFKNSFLKPQISNMVTKQNPQNLLTRPQEPYNHTIKDSFMTPQISNVEPRQNNTYLFVRSQEQNANTMHKNYFLKPQITNMSSKQNTPMVSARPDNHSFKAKMNWFQPNSDMPKPTFSSFNNNITSVKNNKQTSTPCFLKPCQFNATKETETIPKISSPNSSIDKSNDPNWWGYTDGSSLESELYDLSNIKISSNDHNGNGPVNTFGKDSRELKSKLDNDDSKKNVPKDEHFSKFVNVSSEQSSKFYFQNEVDNLNKQKQESLKAISVKLREPVKFANNVKENDNNTKSNGEANKENTVDKSDKAIVIINDSIINKDQATSHEQVILEDQKENSKEQCKTVQKIDKNDLRYVLELKRKAKGIQEEAVAKKAKHVTFADQHGSTLTHICSEETVPKSNKPFTLKGLNNIKIEIKNNKENLPKNGLFFDDTLENNFPVAVAKQCLFSDSNISKDANLNSKLCTENSKDGKPNISQDYRKFQVKNFESEYNKVLESNIKDFADIYEQISDVENWEQVENNSTTKELNEKRVESKTDVNKNYDDNVASKRTETNNSLDTIDATDKIPAENSTIKQTEKDVLESALSKYDIDCADTEEKVKSRVDEWICWFTQIMEEFLKDVIKNNLNNGNVDPPPPWSFDEILLCVKNMYTDNNNVGTIIYKIYNLYLEIRDGIAGKNIKADNVTKMLGCGLLLLETFQAILPNFAFEAHKVISNMLYIIYDPGREECTIPENEIPRTLNAPAESRTYVMKSKAEILSYLKKHFPAWQDCDVNEIDIFPKQNQVIRTFGRNLNSIKIDKNNNLSMIQKVTQEIPKKQTDKKTTYKINDEVKTKYDSKQNDTRKNEEKTNVSKKEHILINTKNDERKSTKTKNDKQKLTSTKNDEQKLTLTKNYEQKLTHPKNDEQKLNHIKNDEQILTNTKSDEQILTYTKNDEQKLTLTKNYEQKLNHAKNDEQTLTRTKNDEQKLTCTKNDEQILTYTKNDEQNLTYTKNDQQKLTNINFDVDESSENDLVIDLDKFENPEYNEDDYIVHAPKQRFPIEVVPNITLEEKASAAYMLIKSFLRHICSSIKAVHDFVNKYRDPVIWEEMTDLDKILLRDTVVLLHENMAQLIAELKSIVEREEKGPELKIILADCKETLRDMRVIKYMKVNMKLIEQSEILRRALKIILNILTDSNSSVSSFKCNYINIFE